MTRTWVLDTETKGTGANVVPLDAVLEKPAGRGEPPTAPSKHRPPPPKPAEPRAPHRFKVVDVMTLEVLAEGADARATVEVLRGVASIVDVRVFVWQPRSEQWRLLTRGEQQMLWEFRGDV